MGSETKESIEGHRSEINLAVWRPLGWTEADEARADAESVITDQMLIDLKTMTEEEWDAKYVLLAGRWLRR